MSGSRGLAGGGVDELAGARPQRDREYGTTPLEIRELLVRKGARMTR